MATQEIIWDDAPQNKDQEISWDDQPSDIKWDKPKSVLDPLDLRTKVSNVVKGFGSGLLKFNMVGQVNKLIGDHYEEIANTQKESLDAVIKAQGDDNPLFQKRRDITKQMSVTNDLLKDPNLAPDAKIELDTQLQKLGGEVSNIDKILTPKYSNYNDLIKSYDKVQGLFDKAKVKKAVGENLIKQHEDILNKFTTAEDRETFSYQLGSGIESMVEAVAVNVAVPGTAFAKSISTGISLAMPGAINMYDRAVGSGMEPAKARVLALGNLATNAALEAASFDFIFKKGANALIKGFATEGTQELTQTFADNATVKTFIDNNQDLTQGLLTSFLVGGIIGGTVGGVQQRGYNRDIQEYKNQFKDKYKDVFAQNGLTEPDVNAYLDTVAQKAIDSQEVITDKMVNDDLLKMAKTLGKETETDALKTQPIQGEIDLNDPKQIDIAIREKNKFISQNENNPAMRNEVAMAIQEREQLAESLQEKINLQNVEAVPAEIGQIKADLKEETGIDISDAQAGAIMREMLKTQTQLVRESDQQQMSEGGKVIVTGGTQVQPERTVTGIPSQRRAELKGIKRPTNIQYQSVAEKNLVEGYMEQGGIKVPGSSEYTFLKAQTENNPELYKQAITNANEEIDSVIKSTEYKSLDEMKEYLKLKDSPIAQDPEVQNEFKNIESAVQVIESASNRIKAAEQKLGKPAKKTSVKNANVVRKTVNEQPNKRTKEPAVAFFKEGSKVGGKEIKRIPMSMVIRLAKNLNVTMKVKEDLGKALGSAQKGELTPIVKLKRAIFEGEFSKVTPEYVGGREYQVLRDAEIIDDNGIINTKKYRGQLGVLKKNLDGLLSLDDIEALNKKLVLGKNYDDATQVIRHEIGHTISMIAGVEVDKSNLLNRALLELSEEGVYMSGEITKDAELRKELKKLTEWWNPYDKKTATKSYIAYRNSASELYAEFLSVYLNDPATAKQVAPKYTRIFEANIIKRPDIKSALDELDRIRNMNESEYSDYLLEQAKADKRQAEEIVRRDLKGEPIKEKLKSFADKFIETAWAQDLNIRREMVKAGEMENFFDFVGKKDTTKFREVMNSKRWISEPYHLMHEYMLMFEQNNALDFVTKDDSDFGLLLEATRQIHDKNMNANDRDVQDYEKIYQAIKKKYSEKDFKKMLDMAEKYYKFFDQHIIQKMQDYKLLTDESAAEIREKNAKYAYRSVAEREANRVSSILGYSKKQTTGASLKSAKGGFGETRNPAKASIELLAKLGYSIEINRANLTFINWMKGVSDPDALLDAKVNAKGVPIAPNSDYELVTIMDNGKPKHYYALKKYYKEFHSSVSQLSELSPQMKLARHVAVFFRSTKTRFNLLFSIKEVFRNIFEIARTIDSAAIPNVGGNLGVSISDKWNFLKTLIYEGIPAAREMTYDPLFKNELARDAQRLNVVQPVKGATFSPDGKEATELLQSNAERLIKMYTHKRSSVFNPKQLAENLKNSENVIDAVKSFSEVVNPFLAISDFGEVVDRSYKIAFYKFLTKKGMSPEDAAVYAKRLAGNPDPTYGGSGRVGIGVVLDFFNPTAQGNAKALFLASKGTKSKTDVAIRSWRIMTHPLVILAVVLPWYMKRLHGDDDDEDPSEFKQKRWMIFSWNGKEFSLPKDNLMQLQHALIWNALDTFYYGIKKKGDAAIRSFEDLIKTMIGSTGMTPDNLNVVAETIFELQTNKDTFTGQEVYNKDASPGIRNNQIMGFIFNKFYSGVIPTKKTFGFISGKSGVREDVTLDQDLIEFKTAKANISVMTQDMIRNDIEPSEKRLNSIYEKYPDLRGDIIKLKSIGMMKRELNNKAKDNKVMKDYAMNILDLFGRYGITGNQKIKQTFEKAQNDPALSPEDRSMMRRYIGIFYGSN